MAVFKTERKCINPVVITMFYIMILIGLIKGFNSASLLLQHSIGKKPALSTDKAGNPETVC
jgi:hypothetical protein